MLTTEWIDGLTFDEFRTRESEATKQRAAEVVWRFAQNAIHRYGIFNGDPHPGNYKFHHDGSVSFLDYGLVKRWSPGEWETLKPAMDAIIVDRDPELLVARMEESGFLPRRPRARPAARLRLRLESVRAVPHRRVHVHPRVDA